MNADQIFARLEATRNPEAQFLYTNDSITAATAQIVSHVLPLMAFHPDAEGLKQLILSVRRALVMSPDEANTVKPELVAAVPVKKSVTDDYIICLEDGKKFKSMKRHLRGLGMTPDEYRAKWGLPSDYPIVAKSYSAKRSQLAKDSGLGRK